MAQKINRSEIYNKVEGIIHSNSYAKNMATEITDYIESLFNAQIKTNFKSYVYCVAKNIVDKSDKTVGVVNEK